MKKYWPIICCLVVASMWPSLARSQAPQAPEGWSVRVGAGTLFAPAFPGSKDYQLLALPLIEFAYADVIEASVQRGIRYNIVRTNGFSAGPIAKLDFGRDEDGSRAFRVAGKKTDALIGLGNVSATVELGGFVKYERGPFAASLELRHGINGHEGLIGEVGIDYTRRVSALGTGAIVSVGPRLSFATTKYTTAFFGVDANQSARSGLARFKPKGGIVSYGVGSVVIYPINTRLSATLLASYERLAGDAESSSLVQARGAADRAIVGLFLTYQLFR